MEKSEVRVLVVDDEQIIREIFSTSLSRWGFQVDEAADGQEALKKCEFSPYHIVITDLNMPRMDGEQLLQRIKARWAETEVIVVTGFGTITNAIEAMKNGAMDFILKPVNFEHVKLTLEKCYHKVRAAAENEQLQTLNNELQEINEMKSKFLAITNHEIRTPLTIIRGYLEILEDILPAEQSDALEVLDILNNTSRQLSNTVDRMHVLSEVHYTRFNCQDEKVDLTEIVRLVHRDYALLFKHRNIDLTINMPREPLLVKASGNGLRLLLEELLQNALKFTPDKGRVLVRIGKGPTEAYLEIEDNGIGIPYDKTDMIFSPFYEVQNSIHHKSSPTAFKGGGMGIGLTLVRELVSAMKGRIWVNSEVESGSSFRVFFPVFQTMNETPETPTLYVS
ncbi:MAG TPA: response regulator [Calditrichia bacterium]|nr:response regulator [Calditrichota bacterium]HQU71244.1 response regulator [Calditrichia bacterium]HQV30710.1 response regulator [Calditrichia bacterium]